MDADFFLVQRMKNGDEDAMETFVRTYYPLILKYCSYHTWDRQNAADLTQETFAHFFASLAKYEHRGKAVHYLYVIAGNLCRDSFREKREMPFAELSEVEGSSTERLEENSMGQLEERLEIERALRRLPEELLEVVILHYFQNLKLREIAEILQIGLPLVKYRASRAKSELRKYLGEEDET